MKRYNKEQIETFLLAVDGNLKSYEHDMESIEAIQRSKPLDCDLIMDRIQNEMRHVNGHPSTIRMNLVNLIDRLFGPEKANEAEQILKEWG